MNFQNTAIQAILLKYRSEAKNQTKCKTAKQGGTIVGGKRGVGSKLKGQS